MEFAETEHRWEERPDLQVSFLMVLHTLRLECEKLMELPASSHQAVKTIASKMSNLRWSEQRQAVNVLYIHINEKRTGPHKMFA